MSDDKFYEQFSFVVHISYVLAIAGASIYLLFLYCKT